MLVVETGKSSMVAMPTSSFWLCATANTLQQEVGMEMCIRDRRDPVPTPPALVTQNSVPDKLPPAAVSYTHLDVYKRQAIDRKSVV